jgi:hypothetical protein
MDKRIIGFLATAVLVLSASLAFAEDHALHPNNSLADWAAAEGYGWTKVDEKIEFCHAAMTTGTHIRRDECVNYQQLIARWEAWNNPRLRGDPSYSSHMSFRQH